MLIFERLTSIFAPDECMSCGEEGLVLCEACALSEVLNLGSVCYRCGSPTRDFTTCKSCRRYSPLSHVWIVSAYDGISRDLIHELKFNSHRSAARPIAEQMLRLLPINENWTVTYIPTSSDHVRGRGFDHDKLIAKRLAATRRLPCFTLLRRDKKTHQVGATRKERLIQVKGAFSAKSTHLIKDSRILLVDDVLTTGASLEEAARVLRKSGAREVDGVVFAR